MIIPIIVRVKLSYLKHLLFPMSDFVIVDFGVDFVSSKSFNILAMNPYNVAMNPYNVNKAKKYAGSEYFQYKLVVLPMYDNIDPMIGDIVKPAYCNAIIIANTSVLLVTSTLSTTYDLVTPRVPEPNPNKN